MEIRTICNYYEGDAKAIAYRIKNATDQRALQFAAKEMAFKIPNGSVLIPVPSSSGLNYSMTVLARHIASLVPNSVVIEAVRRKRPVQSSYLLRKSGRQGLSLMDHLASIDVVTSISQTRPVILIDNVVSSGNTLSAIEILFGRSMTAVVYSDARLIS